MKYLRDNTLRNNKRPLVWNYPNNWAGGDLGVDNSFMTAIRQGNWKLIYFEKPGRLELYNLADDIREEYDLSASNPAKTKEMAKLLTAQLKKNKAQLPLYIQTGKQVPYPDEISASR